MIVVLQCYRRQAIPMEHAKIRPSVTPGPIVTKLGMVDYLGDPYSDASFKFG